MVFLIRIKDGFKGIKMDWIYRPAIHSIFQSLKLSRKQTNEMKELYANDKNHYKFIPHSTPFDYLDTKLRKMMCYSIMN